MKEFVYGMCEGSCIDGQDAYFLKNDSEGAGVFPGGWSLVTARFGLGETTAGCWTMTEFLDRSQWGWWPTQATSHWVKKSIMAAGQDWTKLRHLA